MSLDEFTCHGVDFSGAERHAKKTWVSTWRPGERATTRSGYSHAELVRAIAASPETDGRRHAWLIDAPLGLPRALLTAHDVELTWSGAIDWLASHESPRDWRRACRKVSRKEPRRPIDDRVHTPFSPVNLRMFKQTWHALVSVASPLAAADGVAVLPMAAAATMGGRGDGEQRDGAPEVDLGSRRAWLAESCPASILRDRGPGGGGAYKGPSEANARRREEVVDWLERDEDIPVDKDARRAAVRDTEGDALDSLVILAAHRGFVATDFRRMLAEEPDAAFEAWVFI